MATSSTAHDSYRSAHRSWRCKTRRPRPTGGPGAGRGAARPTGAGAYRCRDGPRAVSPAHRPHAESALPCRPGVHLPRPPLPGGGDGSNVGARRASTEGLRSRVPVRVRTGRMLDTCWKTSPLPIESAMVPGDPATRPGTATRPGVTGGPMATSGGYISTSCRHRPVGDWPLRAEGRTERRGPDGAGRDLARQAGPGVARYSPARSSGGTREVPGPARYSRAGRPPVGAA